MNFLYPRLLYAKFGWNWPCSSQVENFEIFFIYFILLLSPLEERCGPLFVKIWITSSKDALCQIWLKLSSSFKERIFNYFQYNFTISLLSPLWEGCGPSFEKSWIFSTQGCFVQSLVEIDVVVLNKKILKNFNIILLFCYYLPLEKGMAFHLNKLESPSSKDALCQVLMKLTLWFWRNFFLLFSI